MDFSLLFFPQTMSLGRNFNYSASIIDFTYFSVGLWS